VRPVVRRPTPVTAFGRERVGIQEKVDACGVVGEGCEEGAAMIGEEGGRGFVVLDGVAEGACGKDCATVGAAVVVGFVVAEEEGLRREEALFFQ
jgi:hypothetical protein